MDQNRHDLPALQDGHLRVIILTLTINISTCNDKYQRGSLLMIRGGCSPRRLR